MEERPILEVLELVVELMRPDHAPRPTEVDQSKAERVTLATVTDESESTLHAAVGPLVWVRVCIVDPCERGGMDLVCRLGKRGADFRFLVRAERGLRGHNRRYEIYRRIQLVV
jgi:hypothetical protein